MYRYIKVYYVNICFHRSHPASSDFPTKQCIGCWWPSKPVTGVPAGLFIGVNLLLKLVAAATVDWGWKLLRFFQHLRFWRVKMLKSCHVVSNHPSSIEPKWVDPVRHLQRLHCLESLSGFGLATPCSNASLGVKIYGRYCREPKKLPGIHGTSFPIIC